MTCNVETRTKERKKKKEGERERECEKRHLEIIKRQGGNTQDYFGAQHFQTLVLNAKRCHCHGRTHVSRLQDHRSSPIHNQLTLQMLR